MQGLERRQKMKNGMTRFVLAAAAVVGLAGAPSVFAADRFAADRYENDRYDLRQDYRNAARENRDIRADQWRLHEDLENGRYRQAQRERADLNRDRYQRNLQYRDIHRDKAYRFGWR
jgi:hypothetical protein